MEVDRYLIATAQISLAIVGFAGIVAAYRNQSVSEWGEVERFWLRLQLLNSILPFVFSMLGIFVLSTGSMPNNEWRFLSGSAAICLLLYAVMIVKSMRGFSSGDLRSAGSSRRVSYALFLILIAVFLLQLWNLAIGSAFWPFFGAVIALIFGAIFQFVRLVLRTQRQSGDEIRKDDPEEG